VEQSALQRPTVRILVFSASLRADSLNTRLADLAAACLGARGGIVDRAFVREFDCPSYNFDVQSGEGFPSGADEPHRRLQACDGFVVSSPEYNASLPGLLKNAIDCGQVATAFPLQNRGARIRTGDLTDPNGARYQAAPRPDAIEVSHTAIFA
jgi:NAD(P)H-dependent FMN reductase